jgi:hypothetical protein
MLPKVCNRTTAAILAVQLAREHFELPRLCPGLNPLPFCLDRQPLKAANAEFKAASNWAARKR